MSATDFDLRRDEARISLILSGAAFRHRQPVRMRLPLALTAGMVAALAIGGVTLGLARHRAAEAPYGSADIAPAPAPPAVAPSTPALPAPQPVSPLTAPPFAVIPAPASVGTVPAKRSTPVHHATHLRPEPVAPIRLAPRAEAPRGVAHAGAIADPLTGAALRAAQEHDAQRARELNRSELERIGGGGAG